MQSKGALLQGYIHPQANDCLPITLANQANNSVLKHYLGRNSNVVILLFSLKFHRNTV